MFYVYFVTLKCIKILNKRPKCFFFFVALITSKRATETHAAYLPWYRILYDGPALLAIEHYDLTLFYNNLYFL